MAADDQRFISGRQAGKLLLVSLVVEDDTVTLEAPGMEEGVKFNLQDVQNNNKVVDFRMWKQPLKGVDCGDEVGEWLTKVLFNGETKVRLLFKGNVMQRRTIPPLGYNFPQYRSTDRLYYADCTGYMLATESSLEDLNTRLPFPITMNNFRPNIVVKGSPAYDEDDWAFIRIGSAVFRTLKPCNRCVMTTVNPQTGERYPNQEPLRTLRSYRLLSNPPELAKSWSTSPVFGLSLVIDTTGPIAVGDKVLVARLSTNPHLKIF
ncbi:mitochondrial amidoxime reducing component 2-like [Homarus americanus]|uniref:mitochondrial amidoxime reducing component 2-like n=1 Tax=Homarus americanus TaxID=6706 RepID=UPI001C43FB0C|nr:mitochondrial amidoxime reducing component 2-like [Homarus americanus]